MIIAIDFDGTIIQGKYPAIDGLMPEAKACITKLKDNGHYIIINTCRSGVQLVEAINYLLENGIPFDRVNDNHPEQTRLYSNNSRKIYAHIYVDDKNVFGFAGWVDVYTEILRVEDEYSKLQKA